MLTGTPQRDEHSFIEVGGVVCTLGHLHQQSGAPVGIVELCGALADPVLQLGPACGELNHKAAAGKSVLKHEVQPGIIFNDQHR